MGFYTIERKGGGTGEQGRQGMGIPLPHNPKSTPPLGGLIDSMGNTRSLWLALSGLTETDRDREREVGLGVGIGLGLLS